MATKRTRKAKEQPADVSGREADQKEQTQPDAQQEDEKRGVLPQRDLKKNLGCG